MSFVLHETCVTGLTEVVDEAGAGVVRFQTNATSTGRMCISTSYVSEFMCFSLVASQRLEISESAITVFALYGKYLSIRW